MTSKTCRSIFCTVSTGMRADDSMSGAATRGVGQTHREGSGLCFCRLGFQHKALQISKLLDTLLYYVKLHLSCLHLCPISVLSTDPLLPGISSARDFAREIFNLSITIKASITCVLAASSVSAASTVGGSFCRRVSRELACFSRVAFLALYCGRLLCSSALRALVLCRVSL